MGVECKYHAHFTSRAARDVLIKEIKQQSLINQYSAKHCDLNWTIHGCFERNSMFWTPVHCLFSTCHALKTWFELSRVKLYRNGPEGNKNYFDRVSGRFELSRVRITKGKCMKESRGNRFCFELARVRVIGSRL